MIFSDIKDPLHSHCDAQLLIIISFSMTSWTHFSLCILKMWKPSLRSHAEPAMKENSNPNRPDTMDHAF